MREAAPPAVALTTPRAIRAPRAAAATPSARSAVVDRHVPPPPDAGQQAEDARRRPAQRERLDEGLVGEAPSRRRAVVAAGDDDERVAAVAAAEDEVDAAGEPQRAVGVDPRRKPARPRRRRPVAIVEHAGQSADASVDLGGDGSPEAAGAGLGELVPRPLVGRPDRPAPPGTPSAGEAGRVAAAGVAVAEHEPVDDGGGDGRPIVAAEASKSCGPSSATAAGQAAAASHGRTVRRSSRSASRHVVSGSWSVTGAERGEGGGEQVGCGDSSHAARHADRRRSAASHRVRAGHQSQRRFARAAGGRPPASAPARVMASATRPAAVRRRSAVPRSTCSRPDARGAARPNRS